MRRWFPILIYVALLLWHAAVDQQPPRHKEQAVRRDDDDVANYTRHASLAHCDDAALQPLRSAGHGVVRVEAGGFAAVVHSAPLSACTVVTFRSTVSLSNWIDNSRIAQVQPWPSVAPQLRVHEGFWDGYRRLKPGLEALLEKNKECVVSTGFSLGGAMAVVHAADRTIGDIQGKRQRVVSFGAPRVGNRAFADYTAPLHRRVAHEDDFIPFTPAALMPLPEGGGTDYVHGGRLYLFSSCDAAADESPRICEHEETVAGEGDATNDDAGFVSCRRWGRISSLARLVHLASRSGERDLRLLHSFYFGSRLAHECTSAVTGLLL